MKVDLPVSGITCAGCVRTVSQALMAVDGVSEATVNFATRRATVEFDPARTSRNQLVAAIEAAGYQVPEMAGREESLKGRLGIAALLTVPLVIIAMGPGMTHEGMTSVNLRALQMALATPVVAWCGWPFFRAAFKGLRRRSADMNTLVALGTGAAYLTSAVIVLAGLDYGLYFESAAVIITFLLLGRTLEARARDRASDAIRRLAELTPRDATVVRNGTEQRIPIEDVRIGDHVMVRPGERVPVDGVTVEGEPLLDESSLTGESLPVAKGPGATVYAGTVNTTRAFSLEARALMRDTMLSQIVALVERAQGRRAPIARIADEVAARFVPAVLGVAAVTLLVWLGIGTPEQALVHFVAVLIIACPCALGLATPAAILVAGGRGAQLGILFKGGDALEATGRIEHVVFDKTGTLTLGKPRVIAVEGAPDTLALAAAVERWSEHPIARAIVQDVTPAPSTDFEALPGLGVRGRVDGQLVTVTTDTSRPDGTWLSVEREGSAIGSIQVGDRLRPEAPAVVAELMASGLAVSLLSGDRRAVAQAMAAECGITNVIAPVLPHQKADRIQRLQSKGVKVAMVGDGINDAPALATADVGFALGSGTDIALEAAQVSLISTEGRSGLEKIPQALQLARATLRIIRQNLFWAFAYNVIGIPLAAGLFEPWTGWRMDPVFAAAAMALSSVSVLSNSLRLRYAVRTESQ